MAIRAILWDVDDTLFDYTGADRAGALRHLAEEGLLGAYPTPEAALERWREVMEEQFALFLAGELEFHEHRRGRARGFLGNAGLSDAEADAWFNRYVVHYEAAWCLFPDVLPALDALRDGYRHGVLSNSSTRNQDRKLRRLGIRDRFEVLVCADDIGCAKPDPGAFRAACAALGLPPHEVVYVGDQLTTDALGALDAGLAGVWLDRLGREAPDGILCIRGLDELRQALLSHPPQNAQ
ncbi:MULTISPECIES: HAD family hydrolase [unclassified Streptomyces]|uniref:HAD family hydrolase n=1 Tax=unclassified Streptomyces TaxID=2593676 RepID=UPI0022B739B1|nr:MULTISPECIES: HAD family hydrolase [unclassified Streptomyces]MCZ7416346.1 HAD family hydrolase [Streptomyces sp. WMMC897]MCZ7433844.1 HAD family hydrolase [Streptomyces sp. WMMC1477]